jgi:hypothetical protein
MTALAGRGTYKARRVKSQRVVYETPDCGGHRINLS